MSEQSPCECFCSIVVFVAGIILLLITIVLYGLAGIRP